MAHVSVPALVPSHVARWVPPVVFMALIYVQSSLPAVSSAVEIFGDKFLHAAGFGALAWLWIRSLTNRFAQKTSSVYASLAVALTGLYAATDEWHQRFVPSRQSSIGDWVADVAGAVVVASICVYWSARHEAPPTPSSSL